MYQDSKKLVGLWLNHVTEMNREALREFFDFTDAGVESITQEAIQKYAERLRHSNPPSGDVRRRILTVKRFLTWAVGQELVEGAPLKDAAKLVVA